MIQNKSDVILSLSDKHKSGLYREATGFWTSRVKGKHY